MYHLYWICFCEIMKDSFCKMESINQFALLPGKGVEKIIKQLKYMWSNLNHLKHSLDSHYTL